MAVYSTAIEPYDFLNMSLAASIPNHHQTHHHCGLGANTWGTSDNSFAYIDSKERSWREEAYRCGTEAATELSIGYNQSRCRCKDSAKAVNIRAKIKPVSCLPSSSQLLLAAGHVNKFFAFPDEYRRLIYVLKVTSQREVQFYRVLHQLANAPLISHDSLIPLLGFKGAKELTDESQFDFALQSSPLLRMNHVTRNRIYKTQHNSNGVDITKGCTIQNLKLSVLHSNDENNANEVKKLQSYQFAAEKLLKCIPTCRETYVHSSRKDGNKQFGIIKMINLTYNMERSLVLDIKMGRRLYGDEASEEKKERAIKKAMNRSITTLGFSFSGMIGHNYRGEELQVHGGSRSTTDSIEENPLTVEQYANLVFSKYLSAMRTVELAVCVGQMLIKKIEKIAKVLQKQTLAAFYGSSLLFVIDTLLSHPKNVTSKSVVVKMIDFANVTLFTSYKDEDYMFGLHNLLHALRMAVSELRDRLEN